MQSATSVLVVDDELDNFDVIEILLFSEGYQLSYASSGYEVLVLLEEWQPDVILLDVMMPDLDGIEVCRRIKSEAKWRSIPIVIVTALTSKEDLAACLESGADDFVTKPVNGLELRSRVRSMLRIKQQYDELQHLVQLREASLQLREDMSNMVIHDLRNPLASIHLACEMLSLVDTPEKRAQKIQQIRIAVQDLRSLTDSLLIMAKLEAGKLLLNYSDVDCYRMGCEVIEAFQPIATQKRIKLVSDFPKPGKLLRLDAILLRRILDNLLSNALKFSPAQTEVTLAIDYQSGDWVKIQVKDMGSGVSEELREALFEKYVVGESCQGVTQTGLGLAFCKMAIEAHGGTIRIESNQPKGSIFAIDLPSQSVSSDLLIEMASSL